jgi:hypothetical protein
MQAQHAGTAADFAAPAQGACGETVSYLLRVDRPTGDRLYTSWLRIIGGSAPAVPMVELTLTRMGNDIKSVYAEVTLRRSIVCAHGLETACLYSLAFVISRDYTYEKAAC